MSSEDPALDLLAAPDTVFLLRATRDLQKGEEVTICYDQVILSVRVSLEVSI